MAQRLRFGIADHRTVPGRCCGGSAGDTEALEASTAPGTAITSPSRAGPAAATTRGWSLLAAWPAIRVGCLVSCNTFRHPALLSTRRSPSTTSQTAGGWPGRAGSYRSTKTFLGGFRPGSSLVSRFREAVEIVDGLLRQQVVTREGQVLPGSRGQLEAAGQQPRPPLVLGAHGPRMLRIVAEYADGWNSFGTVDEMRERNQVLDEHCASIGRDPGEIRRGLYGWAALMPSTRLASPTRFTIWLAATARSASTSSSSTSRPEQHPTSSASPPRRSRAASLEALTGTPRSARPTCAYAGRSATAS